MSRSKLAAIKREMPEYTIHEIRDAKFAIVVLNAFEQKQVEEQTELYIRANPERTNQELRAQYMNCLTVFHCLRDIDSPNLSERAAESIDELLDILDTTEIQIIIDKYSEMMINKAPRIELMTPEEFDELKKMLEGMQLSELDSVSLVLLTNFHGRLRG